MNDRQPCKICKKKTVQVFNINFKPIPICQDCEYRIVKQSVMDMYKKEEASDES